MATENRPYNFSAGPAILPPEVCEQAAQAVRQLPTLGLSVLEISHRSPEFTEILERAIELCYSVLRIPKTHEVVFLQGGASMQFAMAPMNLRQAGKPALYVDTGVWAQKAIREARLQTQVKVVATGQSNQYRSLPKLPDTIADEDASYIHFTSNNTIYGTEYPRLPRREELGGTPLVVDCSSDIGCRPTDLTEVDLGYAGAQKNLGPSGVTLAFVRKKLLEQPVDQSVPYILRYKTHADAGSRYNTPNTFGILVLKLTLEWLESQGGVEAIGKKNAEKAAVLYDYLEHSSLFQPRSTPDCRSVMNVVWTVAGNSDDERERHTQRFLEQATHAGYSGLEGHRLLGGMRASIYNAFPIEGVRSLVEFMREFEQTQI